MAGSNPGERYGYGLAAGERLSRHGMDADERIVYDQVFGLGFRVLYLEDIERANAGDVRMGTFIMCAAFLDALSLAYSAGVRVPRGAPGKWARFMERYLGEPYREIWDSYGKACSAKYFRSGRCPSTIDRKCPRWRSWKII